LRLTLPCIRLRSACPDSEYDVMAKVLAAAKNAQMKKIGFVQQ
jgi:biopolymer transport protein ExbD